MIDQSLLTDAEKLTADGLPELFEFRLRNGTIFRVKNNDTVIWQGKTWNGFPCKMSGISRSADEQENRPSFTLANPDSIFHKAAFAGLVDKAILKRYQLMRSHLDADLPIYVERMWWVSRVSQLIRNKLMSLELRDMTEGPNFQLPVRVFTPPEYPTVSL